MIEKDLGEGWHYFYNPATAESGLEYDPWWNAIEVLTEPVFVGTMPIRTDVPVLKYADLDFPRFRLTPRTEGWVQHDWGWTQEYDLEWE